MEINVSPIHLHIQHTQICKTHKTNLLHAQMFTAKLIFPFASTHTHKIQDSEKLTPLTRKPAAVKKQENLPHYLSEKSRPCAIQINGRQNMHVVLPDFLS